MARTIQVASARPKSTSNGNNANSQLNKTKIKKTKPIKKAIIHQTMKNKVTRIASAQKVKNQVKVQSKIKERTLKGKKFTQSKQKDKKNGQKIQSRIVPLSSAVNRKIKSKNTSRVKSITKSRIVAAGVEIISVKKQRKSISKQKKNYKKKPKTLTQSKSQSKPKSQRKAKQLLKVSIKKQNKMQVEKSKSKSKLKSKLKKNQLKCNIQSKTKPKKSKSKPKIPDQYFPLVSQKKERKQSRYFQIKELKDALKNRNSLFNSFQQKDNALVEQSATKQNIVNKRTPKKSQVIEYQSEQSHPIHENSIKQQNIEKDYLSQSIHISQKVKERILSELQKAKKQRIYLLVAEKTSQKWKFNVMGPKGQMHAVTISTHIHCNCLDFLKKHSCKHVNFIVSQVAKSYEILQKFCEEQTVSEEIVHKLDELLEKRLKNKNRSVNEGQANDDKTCLICFYDMEQSESLQGCKHCGKNFHTQCLKAKRKVNSVCPMCSKELQKQLILEPLNAQSQTII